MKPNATVEVAATRVKPQAISQSSTNNPGNGKARIKYDRKAESEFFVDNSALAGFTGERILYMAVRELIENSLDSCESNHILPNISLSLRLVDSNNDMWLIICEDNGIGIPSEKVPVAVCSFLTSGKYVERQQRGLFGVGLKMIAAFSTKDTDHPLKVWTKSHEEDTEYCFELRTDIGTNKPIVLAKKSLRNGGECQIQSSSGFRIEAILRARLSPITKNKIYEYISQTSIVNPYAIITFETDEGKVIFDRRTKTMPQPAREVLPHPADMDLKTLKKAILTFMNQKTTLQGVLCNSFQKLSAEKAKEIINRSGVEIKAADKYNEHELIKIVNICKQTKFQTPNTDHLSPIGEEILTAGMTSEYAIVNSKDSTSSDQHQSQTQLSVKVLKPSLTAYSSRTCVINNRPTVVECGIAYGGDISSFKLHRFANKIPLLYDEGSDVAREVVSEVEINKMGITKKEVKEQFANPESKSDRAVELLPIHIFFHICSTKIPYKTAGKESIASEGELKRYMKACLADLYRKVSAQIRKELKIKDAENRLHLYKFYIPLIVDAIAETINVDIQKLSDAFTKLAEQHVKGEITIMNDNSNQAHEDKITSTKIANEVKLSNSKKNKSNKEQERKEKHLPGAKDAQGNKTRKNLRDSHWATGTKDRRKGGRKNKKQIKISRIEKDQSTLDSFDKNKARR